MPNPLPESERRRFISESLKLGVPEDRIRQDLASLEGYGPLSADFNPNTAIDKARLPGGGPPVTPQENAEADTFMSRTLPRMAASTLPGLALAPFTSGMSLPAAMLAEGAAAGSGDLAYQGVNKLVRHEPIDYRESAKVGVAGAIGTGVSRTAFDILSRFANVAPQFTRYFRNPKNIGQYNRTMLEAPKEAEHQLGERIKAAVEEWGSMKTAPRAAKEALLNQATAGGTKVSAVPIIDALEQVKLASPKTATGLRLNKELDNIRKSFMSVTTTPADFSQGAIASRRAFSPRTDLTPKEVDEFLTREIDRRIYALSGSPKNQALAESLANARGSIREALLSALPDEARHLTRQTYEELTKREAAEKAISPGLVSLETKMRNLFKPGHQAEIDALRYVSEKTGVDFVGEAFKLAQKRAFSPDERLAIKGLDAIMEIIRGAAARPIVKTAAPLQPAIEQFGAAMASGYYGGQKRQSP